MTRIYSLFFLCGFFLLISCNNDLELFGDINEKPVIYGLISITDDQQYIRLERSFADPNTSAIVLAKDENAVYYQDAIVELVDENDNRFPLTRVNAADEGFVRRPGDFLTEPNYLYKIGSDQVSLEAEKTYRIEVSKGESVIASGSTVCVDKSRVRRPVLAAAQRRINFFPGQLTDIAWSKVDNAGSYRILFDFTILENNSETGQGSTKELQWPATAFIRHNNSGNMSQSINLSGESFFNFLAANLEADPNVSRQIARLDIRLETYGREIGNYLDIINANSGITSAQEVPSYTNIVNGLGIFSSTSTVVAEGLVMTDPTLNELTGGSTTGALNFSR